MALEGNNISTFLCETSYSTKKELRSELLSILVALNSIALVVNVIANVAVIAALVKTNQLHNSSLKLILILSASDCCLATITQSLFSVMLSKFADKDYCSLEAAVQFFAIFFTHTSGYTIALIGFDRFARMKFLTRYTSVVNKTRARLAVAICLLLSLIQAVLYVVGTMFQFFAKAKQGAVVVDFIIALSVLVTYVATLYVVRRHRQKATNRELLNKVDQAVTRLASFILLTIVLFYVTYVLISFVHSSQAGKAKGKKRMWLNFSLFVGYMLAYFNSIVNAIIFLCVNGKAGRWVLKTVGVKGRSGLDRRLSSTDEKSSSLTGGSRHTQF